MGRAIQAAITNQYHCERVRPTYRLKLLGPAIDLCRFCPPVQGGVQKITDLVRTTRFQLKNCPKSTYKTGVYLSFSRSLIESESR